MMGQGISTPSLSLSLSLCVCVVVVVVVVTLLSATIIDYVKFRGGWLGFALSVHSPLPNEVRRVAGLCCGLFPVAVTG